MRAGSFARLFLTATVVATLSCGSVASHSDASGAGGAAGQGGAGAAAAGGAGGGGGGGASGAGGSGGAPPGDGGLTVIGGLSPLGPAPAAAGTIQVIHARLQPSPTCNGNVCVSGGLIP